MIRFEFADIQLITFHVLPQLLAPVLPTNEPPFNLCITEGWSSIASGTQQTVWTTEFSAVAGLLPEL